tara:strand:- start:910 stop:1962 length:1053 start_codon:yes stop_codon:yes gene_type:complete
MFINNSLCISPQHTYSSELFEGKIELLDGKLYKAIEPEYRGLIPLGLLRRLSKAVRMGIATGLPLITQEKVDGIIVGSSNGSMDASIKFLNQIMEYDEGTLTPTNFVQSTSNSIAGNIALLGKVTGYNNTHVNQGLSFEAALLDAFLYFEDHKNTTLLVGGVEEVSETNHNIDSQRGLYKKEDLTSEGLLNANSPGTYYGEGAVMFTVSEQKTPQSIVKVKDVDLRIETNTNNISTWIQDFLDRNHCSTKEVDTLFLGYNGDSNFDHYYNSALNQLFESTNCYTYKNLCGEFASTSAFATWLATQLAAGKQLPSSCLKKGTSENIPKWILIYNHFEGNQHGLILLRNVTN